jgi:hypothetical protein
MLKLALQFHILVTNDLASDFFHFAFDFVNAASGLVLVRGVLLSWVLMLIGVPPVCDIPIAERTHRIKPGRCGSPHRQFLLNAFTGRFLQVLCALAYRSVVRPHT